MAIMVSPHINRRHVLRGLYLSVALIYGGSSWLVFRVPAAVAAEDGGDGNGDSGGSDGGGNGGAGSGGSGSSGSEGGDSSGSEGGDSSGSEGGGSSGSEGGGSDSGESSAGGGNGGGPSDQNDQNGGLSNGVPSSGGLLKGLQKDGTLAHSLRGKAADVREIRSLAKRLVPGELLDIQLDKQGSLFAYHVRILDSEGRIIDMKINAVTRRVMSVGTH